MLDPKQIAEMDQARTQIIETLPPLWWGLYEACVEQGFTAEQAMQIVVANIAAMISATGKG